MAVEGLDKLNRRLKRMPIEARAAIKTELHAGADRIVSLSKSLVPVHEGALRDSIRKEDGVHELQVRVVAGGRSAIHARWIEFGRKGAPAQPFFFPAFRALKRAVMARVNRAITKAAKLEASR